MENLPGADGWSQRVRSDDFNVRGVIKDLSWVFCHQVAQQLPVTGPGRVVPVIPTGPADCNECKRDASCISITAFRHIEICQALRQSPIAICNVY